MLLEILMDHDLLSKRDRLTDDLRRLNSVHADTGDADLRRKVGRLISAKETELRQSEMLIDAQDS